MKNLQTIAIAALALSAAACATPRDGTGDMTQQIYGNVHPNVPSNWTRSILPTGSLSYACSPPQCEDAGSIIYAAARFNENAEHIMREKGASTFARELILKEAGNLARSNNYGPPSITVRDTSNKDIAGFETVGVFPGQKGTLYVVTQATAKGFEGRRITGTGTSLAKARHNLQIGIQGAK